jgi:2-dehydropantoate 2-reductase
MAKGPSASPRCPSCSREAGFKSPALSDVRAEIWMKLWGNLTFNPVSGLSHATLEDVCRFARTGALAGR